MKTMMTMVLSVLFLSSSGAFARDLEDVMSEMGGALRSMTTDAAAPSVTGQTAAQSLKTLSIEASVLSPDADAAKKLEFEGLLLQVAVKANAYQQANLARDSARVQTTITEIRALMSQGHGAFRH